MPSFSIGGAISYEGEDKKMEIFQLILSKIGTMYSLIIIGFILYKIKIINNKIVEKLTFLLVWIINPIIIVGQYQTEFSEEKLFQLGISFIFSFLAMTLGFIFAIKISKNNTERLGIGFPNGGFIGIPLISSIIGVHGVFYLSAYLTVFNLYAYTYGIYLVTKKTTYISFKKIMKNPGIIAVITGILMFIFSVRLPSFLNVVSDVGIKLNTPLAMIVLGTYIAGMDIVKLITDKKIYFISFIKLTVVPVITLLFFMLFPFVEPEIRQVVLLATCTPVGLTAPLYSQLFGGDYIHAARLVGLSTILSIITIPMFVYIMEMTIR